MFKKFLNDPFVRELVSGTIAGLVFIELSRQNGYFDRLIAPQSDVSTLLDMDVKLCEICEY